MLEIWFIIIITVALILGSCLFRFKIERRPEVDTPLQRNSIYSHVPRDLKHEIQYMDHLNGYEFEDYTVWLLHQNGFIGIKQTGKNHDYGLDVLAYRHHVAYGIQCKHYKKRRIKRHVIKQTADGAHFYGTQRAVILTNTVFSRPAIHARRFFHVQLWDRPVLIRLIKRAIINYHRSHRNE